MALDHTPTLDRHFDRLATSKYLSDHGLSVAVSTLASWAVHGRGPKFKLLGRKPLYPLAEIDRWANEQLGHAANSTTAHDAMRSGGAI
jgi:hypothetical protein